ncbi:MAG: hypothetical protein DRJ59_04865 [Thermoprotei archaeon]|nr:MAG: hypothetical protein DRJ59_04865 [Thermoprotei archaeon]
MRDDPGMIEEKKLSEMIEQEKLFFKLRDQIMEEADRRGIILRLIGAIAFRTHCSKFKHLFYTAGRVLSDIDFVSYRKYCKKVEKLFSDLGWEEDVTVRVLYGAKRRIFYCKEYGIHSDVFFDKLEMCHDINFKGRLEIDYPTISLVDMLLEKLQIVKINEKDLIDVIVLLREHDVGDGDKEMINVGYFAKLLSNDWGLWRTCTMNLNKVKQYVKFFKGLTDEDRSDVIAKVDYILKRVEETPKSMKWKLRARIGDKKPWYREVEEVYR